VRFQEGIKWQSNRIKGKIPPSGGCEVHTKAFTSTGILHTDRARPTRNVEDFVRQVQDEIEEQLLHGKGFGALNKR
jgi:hypothetical protein